jgi:hypothetical protein
MSNSIPAVQGSAIKHCILIDLTVNETDFYISNAYGPVTYQGNTYTQLGHFLSMGEMQDDLKVTNNQISLSLSGIPPDDGSPNYLTVVLNSNIKGSRIKIYRAFFNPGDDYFNPNQVYLRFDGYVSNYSLSENFDQDNLLTSNNISIQCSSIHAILERKFSGRRTNDGDQKYWFPTDTGMYRVKTLTDSQFDFGKPV